MKLTTHFKEMGPGCLATDALLNIHTAIQVHDYCLFLPSDPRGHSAYSSYILSQVFHHHCPLSQTMTTSANILNVTNSS